MIYLAPKAFEKSFTCPHCGAISHHTWRAMDWNMNVFARNSQGSEMGSKYAVSKDVFEEPESQAIRVGTCQHCRKNTLWVFDVMFYPNTGEAPFPNNEMPDNVKKLYLEAASISTKSPRGASALQRLAIQVLCKELGEEGKNINTDIANLVKKGLPEIVQQSLDIVRVTGNDAVHPGLIDTDNPETATQLFNLLNVIIEYMIALPKKVSGIYASLPVDKIAAIANRDKT